MEDKWVEKRMAYAHTLGNGGVVVVTGVPVWCEEGEEEFCGFAPEVAERLEALLRAVEARGVSPGEVVTVEFSRGLEGSGVELG